MSDTTEHKAGDIMSGGAGYVNTLPPDSPTLSPEDHKVSLTGEKLTLEQRVDNLELIITKFIPSVEQVLKVYRDEIIKTQKFVIMSLEKGTKNQKKLLVPPQYRKPHLVTDEEPKEDILVDNQGNPLNEPKEVSLVNPINNP